MPLFNPTSVTSTTQPLFYSSTTVLSGNSNFDSIQVANFSNSDQGKVSIVNTGSSDMWIGHDNALSETRYTAKIAPSGLYESPNSFTGAVFVLQNDVGSCITTIFSTEPAT